MLDWVFSRTFHSGRHASGRYSANRHASDRVFSWAFSTLLLGVLASGCNADSDLVSGSQEPAQTPGTTITESTNQPSIDSRSPSQTEPFRTSQAQSEQRALELEEDIIVPTQISGAFLVCEPISASVDLNSNLGSSGSVVFGCAVFNAEYENGRRVDLDARRLKQTSVRPDAINLESLKVSFRDDIPAQQVDLERPPEELQKALVAVFRLPTDRALQAEGFKGRFDLPDESYVVLSQKLSDGDRTNIRQTLATAQSEPDLFRSREPIDELDMQNSEADLHRFFRKFLADFVDLAEQANRAVSPNDGAQDQVPAARDRQDSIETEDGTTPDSELRTTRDRNALQRIRDEITNTGPDMNTYNDGADVDPTDDPSSVKPDDSDARDASDESDNEEED